MRQIVSKLQMLEWKLYNERKKRRAKEQRI